MPSSPLTRRRALQTVCVTTVTGFAGCLSDVDTADRDPSDLEVSFDADVLRGFSDEHPARIRLEFSNGGDETLLFVSQEGG